MGRISFTLFLLTVIFVGVYLARAGIEIGVGNKKPAVTAAADKKTPDVSPVKSKSVFVPYWSADSEFIADNFDTLIYFGISPGYQGINRQDEGFKGLEDFNSVSAGKKKLLTLRMLNDELNNHILENKVLQEKIITETLEVAELNSFDGVVLDLEFQGLFNTDNTTRINEFVQIFYSAAKRDYRQFYLTVYGDNFFRRRGYDLDFLGRNSDGIFIMAYDFHKSRGEPGPNFPFDSGSASSRGDTLYQYDFKKMVSDFSALVPKEKLTVVFGMFGYNWMVDEKKRPVKPAEALSLNEIRNKFLKNCEFKNCISKRDSVSAETEVNYIVSSDTPDEGNIYRIDYHIVWFEDEESVRLKTDYLRKQGIGRISYWASGYF